MATQLTVPARPALRLKDLAQQEEKFVAGHRLCRGCPEGILMRLTTMAIGEQPAVIVNATSCLEVSTSVYPYTTWKNMSWYHNAFENSAAAASGVEASLRALQRKGKISKEFAIIAIGGDGGTFDMGIQSLSGAAERGTDFMYVCYDNEAYMNTGVQRSSATPSGAVTTTTPVIPKEQPKKDFMQIMEAHSMPYLASVSCSYPADVYEKFLKAKDIKGTRFFHLSAPCPTGWWYPTKDTVKIGRMMVESGIFILYEIEDGKLSLTGKSLAIAKSGKRKPVEDYIRAQGRFKKISPEQVKDFQRQVDQKWESTLQRAGF